MRPSASFVVGANLPWIGYGTDFGASRWFPEGGLSARPESLATLEGTLASLAGDGLSVVRVFVLCDGRSGIRFDREGLPTGLDEAVFADMDALLDAARVHGMRLMPVLLDFHLCAPRQVVEGVQLGGRAHLLGTAEGRAALVERILLPLFERYGREETVWAWDVMNEPEWCLEALGAEWVTVPFEALQDFLRHAVDCAHASARQPVTIGCAGTWQLDLVAPLGLDVYEVHWYERFGWRALEQPVETLGVDRPVILGEFSGRGRRWRVADVLETARRAGYEAALIWSVLSGDKHSGYPIEAIEWARTQGLSQVRPA